MAKKYQRLLKLATILETVPKERFNLRFWEGLPTEDGMRKVYPECGFSGCAIGWAAQDKEFKRAGFKLEASRWDQKYSIPVFKGERAFSAVEKFFGISQDSAEYLFTSSQYGDKDVSPKAVSRRIRWFVAKKLKLKEDARASA